MRINFRIDSKTSGHIRFTIFMDGRNCGQLTTSPNELKELALTLESGIVEGNHSVEINHLGVYETSCPFWKDDWSK